MKSSQNEKSNYTVYQDNQLNLNNTFLFAECSMQTKYKQLSLITYKTHTILFTRIFNMNRKTNLCNQHKVDFESGEW